MYALFITAMMGALISLILVRTKPGHEAAYLHARAMREAVEVIAYRKAIGNYLCTHPGVQGSIETTELAFLPGMTQTKWANHIENGRIFMYTADSLKTRMLAAALGRRFDTLSIYMLSSDKSVRVLFSPESSIPVIPGAIAANSLVVVAPAEKKCPLYPSPQKTLLLDDGTFIDLEKRSVRTPAGATITFSETVMVDGIPINDRIPTTLADKTHIATNGEILTKGPHAIYLASTFVRIDGQDILWKGDQ